MAATAHPSRRRFLGGAVAGSAGLALGTRGPLGLPSAHAAGHELGGGAAGGHGGGVSGPTFRSVAGRREVRPG